jgi:hypothetical protein
MAKQQQNLPAKLHRQLSLNNQEMRRHLGSESDYAKYLVARRDGINFDGSAPEY